MLILFYETDSTVISFIDVINLLGKYLIMCITSRNNIGE